MQCEYYQILLRRTCEQSLWRGGHFIEVIFKTGLTVYSQHKPSIVIFPFYSFILFYFYVYFIFSVLSQTHVWIFTQPTITRNYAHCCKFYSEKDKCIAVNCLSIGEAGMYSKEHNNNNKKQNSTRSRGSIEKNKKRIKEIRKERRKNKREQEYHTILIYQKEGVQRKQIQEQKKEIKSIDKRLKR